MVSFIDIGLLGGAKVIFAFIFIWVVIYGVLIYTKWLGDDRQHLYALIAIALAVLTVVTPQVTRVIIAIIPWMTFLIIAIVIMIIALMSVGYTRENITKTITGKEWGNVVTLWIIIISVIIFISGIGAAFFTGDNTASGSVTTNADTQVDVNINEGTTASGNLDEVGQGALFATLFHPKVLGLILVMLIGVFLVQQLGKGSLV